jgi:predicted DNA-binding transcriptional regulator AlpA
MWGPKVKLIDFKRLAPDKGITYSRDHLRRKVKAEEFPAPISVSEHRISWDEDEIDEWLAAKKRARNNGPSPARSIKNFGSPTTGRHEALRCGIEELGLSLRVTNALVASGIFYLSDLLERSVWDLLATPNIGKSLGEIEEMLARLGIQLGMGARRD